MMMAFILAGFSLSFFSLLAVISCASSADASVTYYQPMATNINNISFVINGTGAPGIFNSSTTPGKLYGMYNWCNMPHVRKSEYKAPPGQYQLRYVEVIHRHHKRTPYGSNTFFHEDVKWDCSKSLPFFGLVGRKSTQTNWQMYVDAQNPWSTSIGPGFPGSDCQFPQITSEGWEDSRTHGSDLRAVYASLLSLPSAFDPSIARIRVTNNVITSQVASGLLSGLFPSALSQHASINAFIQPDSIDSLEPTYSCPRANSIRNAYTGSNSNWTLHLDEAKRLYEKLDFVSGIASDDSAGWHTSFDHYYDNLSAKQCQGKPLPCSINDTGICVTQDEANEVYRLGNYEYSYYFRDAPNSALYSALHYGAWVLELKSNLEGVINRKNQIRYSHNIAHDGSISPLLGFLQISEMVWPGMGSEVVFELYEKRSQSNDTSGNEWFLRVLWSGQPSKSSVPTLGTMDMIPLQTFFDYVNHMLGSGSDLYSACFALI